MTRAREWAIPLAVTVGVLIVPAIWLGWFVISASQKSPPRNPGPPPPSIIMADAGLGYTMRPSLDVSLQTMRIVTDRIGTRVAPADREREIPQNAILVVGDSQMFGYGLDYEDTFPAQLSARLGMPVINGGVPGYGTTSAYRKMKALMAYRPRAIVIGHLFDHHVRSVSPCYPGFILRCLMVPYVDVGRSTSIKEADSEANAERLAEFTAYNDYMSDSGDHNFGSDVYWTAKREWASYFISSEIVFRRRSPADTEAKAAMSFLYGLIRDEARFVGIPIVVVYIPNYSGGPAKDMPQFLSEVFRETNINVADPTKKLRALQATSPNAIMVPNDGHLSAKGHRTLVDAVAPMLGPYLRE
jgi:lysophospholipase L1-like esterase